MSWWDDVVRKTGNATSDYLVDPLRSTVRNPMDAAGNLLVAGSGLLGNLAKKQTRDQFGNLLDDASGATAADKAFDAQQEAGAQAQGSIGDAYTQGMGLLSPYQQNAGQNFNTLQSNVNKGFYTPNYRPFMGQTASGNQAPQFSQYGGPMQSGAQAPEMQRFDGQMSSGNQAPTWQGYGGALSSGNQAPEFHKYNGQMSTFGQNDPQYQNYQGSMFSGLEAPQYQSFNAQQRPELGLGKTNEIGAFGLQGQDYGVPQQFQRQEATAENIQKFANPYLDQIIQKGTNAIQGSAAAKGLLQSSGTINQIGDWASSAAQNNFNDAFGKFQDSQNAGMGDFRDQRNFNANQIGDTFNRFASANNMAQTNFGQDRGFGAGQNSEQNQFNLAGAGFNSGEFNSGRNAGMANNQSMNANETNLAGFRQGALEGDRGAGMSANQFANNFGMQGAQF
ncbi:MAG: hypothetical protein M3Y08_18225, partial [Fibrobacterota bacterium]|nr:hypothetical protein [Fibrobacterota bacterium]